MAALLIEQVLAKEAEALRAPEMRSPLAPVDLEISKRARVARTRLSGDRRDTPEPSKCDVEKLKAFYRSLNRLNRAALCCSGGGIRSATFCLGIIQALAGYSVPTTSCQTPNPADGAVANGPAASADGSTEAEADEPVLTAGNSLLARFSYLSTVSGGGYIGSWLSSWRARQDFPAVLRSLTGRPAGPDIEPPELSWLRAYSNYLTPTVGLGSADTWTGVTLFVRNVILNWLIIIPVVCLALLALKFVATSAVWIARSNDFWLVITIGLLGVALLIVAQSFTTRHRPTRRENLGDGNVTQAEFLRHDFIFAFISAIAVTSFFSSRFSVAWASTAGKAWVLTVPTLAGLAVYAAGWIAGWPSRSSGRDFIRWAASGLVYGALIGAGTYLFLWLEPYCDPCSVQQHRDTLLVGMIFGVPWALSAQLTADTIFVGLTSYEKDSDSDREWLGRAAAWIAVGAVVWAVVAFLVFAGGYYFEIGVGWVGRTVITSLGGMSGLLTAILGKSSKTSATPAASNRNSAIYNIILGVAGPLFAAILVVVLSVGLDKLLLGISLITILTPGSQATAYILLQLFIGTAIAAVVAWLASSNVNINRFSLHAVYRNRLMRAYLGASHRTRDPDELTGFDIEDNISVHKLWPPKPDGAIHSLSLFHVVNIALNVVSTSRLAWQERKAEPFTVTPLHSGSAPLGFRRSEDYGDRPGEGGITLGTAMAISGAAVSPNMGYHSSPSLSLLLTLFNVRLGWWLGNPGDAGEASYQTDGPRFAARPLFDEAFGLTTDDDPYVYLSDGGHFENLGLYEMVRRRCRFIVVIDAGCDPKFAFEDLGNAVRKVYIDLGIRIEFIGLDALRNRPLGEPANGSGHGLAAGKPLPYHAIGFIDYPAADNAADGGETCEQGYVLYIKPAYHGTEGAGIRSYATAHRDFPHESTVDQWFTESQFESYRALGLDIGSDILKRRNKIELPGRPGQRLMLGDVLAGLHSLERVVSGD